MYDPEQLDAEVREARKVVRDSSAHLAFLLQAIATKIIEGGEPHVDPIDLAEHFARVLHALGQHAALFAAQQGGSLRAAARPVRRGDALRALRADIEPIVRDVRWDRDHPQAIALDLLESFARRLDPAPETPNAFDRLLDRCRAGEPNAIRVARSLVPETEGQDREDLEAALGAARAP